MNKKVTFLLTTILLTGLLTGCGQSTKKDTNGATYNLSYNEKEMSSIDGSKVSLSDNDDLTLCKTSGFGYLKPESWSEIQNQDGIDGYSVDPEGYYMLYMPEEQVNILNSIDEDTATEDEINQLYQTAYASEFYAFVIYRVNSEDEMTIADAEEFKADFDNVEEIGSIDKDTFYFAYNDKIPEEGFSETDKADIQKIIDTLNEVKDSIMIFPPTDPMDDFKASMSEFTTTDLDGNEITADIFKDYDVTMVNVWATWCKYCILEMPEIEELYEELPEKTNIITICTDGATETDAAKEILNKVGAKFTTINSCDEIEKNVLDYVTGYPTTFFVDKDGKVVGELQIGTPASEGEIKEAYLELIQSALESNK